jgi:hypothetical protein
MMIVPIQLTFRFALERAIDSASRQRSQSNRLEPFVPRMRLYFVERTDVLLSFPGHCHAVTILPARHRTQGCVDESVMDRQRQCLGR